MSRLVRSRHAVPVAALLALTGASAVSAGADPNPVGPSPGAIADPANRASHARVTRIAGADRVSLDDAVANRLFDRDAATTIALSAGETLEVRFVGAPRWINRLALDADGAVAIEIRALDGSWGPLPDATPTSGDEHALPDLRLRGLRIRSADPSASASVAGIEARFEQVDPDHGRSVVGRSGGSLLHLDWCNDYSATTSPNLSLCDDDARGLRDELDWGYADHGNSGALENHFKRNDLGSGNNGGHIDWADFAYYAGHGVSSTSDSYWGTNLSAIALGTFTDDRFVVPSDGRSAWGDGNLEWITAAACQILTTTADNYWASNMQGLHLMLGALTNIADAEYGEHFGDRMVDNGWFDSAWTIKSSWWDALDNFNSTGTGIVIGETSSAGGDYVWGEGSVIADPVDDSTFHRWRKTLTSVAARETDVLTAHIVRDPARYERSAAPTVFPASAPGGLTVKIDPTLLTEARQGEMIVYDVAPVDRDLDDVAQVAQSICQLQELLCDPEIGRSGPDELIAIDGARELRMNEHTGRYHYIDTDRFLAWTTTPPQLPTENQAVAGADELLATWAGGDLPGRSLVGIDYIEQAALTKEGEGAARVMADSTHAVSLTVNYQRRLGEFAVGGGGATARVTFGHQGEIQQVRQGAWRPVVPGGTIQPMSVSEVIAGLNQQGWDACIEGVRLATDSIEITSWELGYFEPGSGIPTQSIRPCYIVNALLGEGGSGLQGDTATPAEFYVWADVRQPRAAIQTPDEPHEVPPGAEVCFEGAAGQGQPPYTFRWTTVEGELLGEGPSPCAALFPPAPDETGHQDDVVTVELEVVDATGRTGRDFVDVHFAPALDVDDPAPGAPVPVTLGAIRPNPTRAGAAISFSVAHDHPVHVTIGIYDVTGRLVRELVDGVHAPGTHLVAWDGHAADGHRAAPGAYFTRLEVDDHRSARKLVLLD